MNIKQDDLIFEQSLGFFGTITASQSHEINNVITTINEVSGLSHDLLVAAEQGRPQDPARQKSLLELVAAQVERGKGYIQLLNRFAHTVDQPGLELDAKENMEQISALCERFAKMRIVEIETKSPEESIHLHGSPFDLQHIIYRMFEIALSISNRNDSIQIELEAEGNGARFTLTGQTPYEASEKISSKLSFLLLLVEKLGGRIESDLKPGCPVSLVVIFPQSFGKSNQ
ncbi:MAG: hypothetical protein GY847_27295 [Proteobacteria bacterium]|nr:hypothetical protein [Pseudomonadota bacterium]